ncbi:SDR family oxidoreductase [Rhodanobacter glycinis]|uniref:SDR family oxidoreductase n=1 Tax=Rhodanobacter glycinis TaxID=582702 RepID=A0A5B9E2E3_9GAMM|nr:SDR family oxidoreductase [Rhodanobacter glycinis]QEE24417.1 SDR family oxidoreductase [Rhodanobacter glycinis]
MQASSVRHGGGSAASFDAVYPDLYARRVFITGGGSGIGAALVEAFVRQGAHVAFVDIDEHVSRALVEQIRDHGPAPWWRRCDVTDVQSLQQAIADAAQALGALDVLVNNVGSDDRHTLEEVTPAYWDQRIGINQRAAFFAIQAVVPVMRRLGRGSIINLGSTGWQTKNAGYPCYATAKSSMNGMMRGMAKSLGEHRIRINVLSPGWVMTERQQTLWLTAESEKELMDNQCLPDKIMPADIASMALFLASDASRACTAQEFVVDAGWT